MSSESNGSKPDSQRTPSSGPSSRASGRAPSAWGATRDALAAAHNLDALLRSSSVLYRTILDLLPELRTSAGILHDTFERARTSEGAAAGVGAYGVGRTAELVALLDATALADEERDDLAVRARELAGELEAAADLLALIERAADPVVTEVNVDLLVRETVRLSGSARGTELAVRFDAGTPECAVVADPYVVGPLVAALVARVISGGAPEVAVRVRCTGTIATFVVEPSEARDAALPSLPMRILPAVPPTEAAVREVAARIGATLELSAARGWLHLAQTAG